MVMVKIMKGKTHWHLKIILFAFCFDLYILSRSFIYLLRFGDTNFIALNYFAEFCCILKRFSTTSILEKSVRFK
jgi:hypothetical protein